MDSYILVIHGGAGTITRKSMPPEKEHAYREKLSEALLAGYTILKAGGSSVDAVEAAVRIMEDSPLFNAGRGSVFSHEGKNEMDASIMDGRTGKAGAVAGVTTIKNPVSAAKRVMEKSPHVLLAGRGAEAFAREQGIDLADPSYFYDEYRWKQLERLRDSAYIKLDHSNDKQAMLETTEDHKYGTVGAVALDRNGNLAAATSTGGMTNKRYGRVGDSPIIGAGTYAGNRTCAVSCTGHGEHFIRNVAAYDISALMEYAGLSLEQASRRVIMEKLKSTGGDGGAIAVDREGNMAMPFNTPGMYRGYIRPDGSPHVFIYDK